MLTNFSIIVVVLTSIANFYIAFSVYRNNPRSATHFLLSFLSVTLAFWTIFNYLALSPGSEEIRLLWVRIVMAVTSAFGPFVFLLAITFPNTHFTIKKNHLIFVFLGTFLVALLSLSPFVFSDLKNTPNGDFELVPSWGIIIFGINLMGYLTLGFALLIRHFRKSTGLLRKQLKLFLVGISISFTLMTLTNFVAVVVFKTIQLTSLGPPFTLVMVSAIGYAIVRHKFLNIRVLATEVFTLSLWVLLLIRIFLYAATLPVLVFDVSVFALSIMFGTLLVRSVRTEVEQKEKLQELTHKLTEMDKKKNEFISMAAHELRAPLTAVRGFISMVLDGDTGPVKGKTVEFLRDSLTSSERMIRLVNNMLDVGRIEEGRLTLNVTVFPLSKIVQSVHSEFQGEALSQKLEFSVNTPENIKDLIEADQDKIHEVVVNLVSNAIKYTEKGSVSVTLSNPRDNFVRLEVTDTGVGITPEEQKKLFHKFYRIQPSSGQTAVTGTGLGLYISKLLMERFNGQIGIISEVNHGSTFWIELPVAKNTESPAAR